MDLPNVLFALLKAAVSKETPTEEVKNACTDDVLEKVFILAQKHDLAHLPGCLDLPDSDATKKMKKAAQLAMYRSVQMGYEFERICKAFDSAEIPYIPLKGAVIRGYYPESWMRTSCDMDILVHEADLEKAVGLLVNELTYQTDGKKHYHDISLFSKSGVHLELHFSICENTEKLDGLLSRVWDYATPGSGCRYELEKNYFAFYLLAHMSYHFAGGGCGLRSFLDLYLLQEQGRYEETLLREHLDQCGLTLFYDGVCALVDVWFREKPHTALTKAMEHFLCSGGAYGSGVYHVAIQQKRKGGKARYLLGRIFMPYSTLKIRYRVLEKMPVLYPVMLIWRWIETVFSGKARRAANELDTTNQIDKKQADAVFAMFDTLGLS